MILSNSGKIVKILQENNYIPSMIFPARNPYSKLLWGLDSAVNKALACHCCDPGLNPGVGMLQGSGRPSKVGGFPQVFWFPPESQHLRLRERVCKFFELSV